jgi:hypothetical protein
VGLQLQGPLMKDVDSHSRLTALLAAARGHSGRSSAAGAFGKRRNVKGENSTSWSVDAAAWPKLPCT